MGLWKISLCGRQFHDLAGVHHRDLVRDARHHAQVVADVKCGGVVSFFEFGDQIQHRGFDGHIQRGGGLVHDEQGRVVEHRHGDDHALLLSARKLVRDSAASRLRDRACKPF